MSCPAMVELALFQSFLDFEDAEPVMQALDLAGVPYRAERDQPAVDVTFNLDAARARVLLFVPYERLTDARRALGEAEDGLPAEVDAQHPFRAFTVAELKEVALRPREWAPGDEGIVRLLLAERGVTVEVREVEQQRQQDLAASRKAVRGNGSILATAYGLATLGVVDACFLLSRSHVLSPVEARRSAMLHGTVGARNTATADLSTMGLLSLLGLVALLGIALGWSYATSTRRDLEGRRYYYYERRTRRHGWAVILLGACSFLFWLCKRL